MMHGVIIALQFSALIPLIIYLLYKSRLNSFFKLLLASIFLSILFDAVSTPLGLLIGNNIAVICLYYILNTILITYLWQKVPFYINNVQSNIQKIGISFLLLMIATLFIFKLSTNALYLINSLNVLLGLIFALIFYYQKVINPSTLPLSKDPYFISATAYILLCLSTIIIIVAQIIFDGHEHLTASWVVRQIFYAIYNIIIAIAFYTLYKSQVVKK